MRTRRVLGILGATVGLVTMVACTGSSPTGVAGITLADRAPAGTAAGAAPNRGQGDASGTGASSGSAGGSSTANGPAPRGTTGIEQVAGAPDGRQVIRTASVTVEITQPRTEDREADTTKLAGSVAEAALKVRALAGGTGYVGASESSGSVASISLRVPTSSYESVMKALSGVGVITSREEKAQDVSAQLVDVGSRIETMRASVDRVRALLARAEQISDVVALESQLEQRQSDLDSLLRQQSALAGQAALSTITVIVQGRLTGVTVAGTTEPQQQSGFLAGVRQGWAAFTDFVGGIGQVVGAMLPFLPVLAVLGFGVLWMIRRVRRREPAAADALPPTPTTA